MSRLEKTPVLLRTPRDAKAKLAVAPGLLVLDSSDTRARGRFCALVEKICVGRDEEGDVNFAINDRVISRRHFVINKDVNDKVWLTDQKSTNGTFVEGQRATRVALTLGTIIRAGDTLLEYNVFPVPLPKVTPNEPWLWRSAAMAEVVAAVTRVTVTQLPVLILGETGTGKELIARNLHKQSGRTGPFIAVNCSAIPAELSEAYFFGHKKGSFTGAVQDAIGYWLSANDGTLFLDEIGELSLPLQAKILRVLDSGELIPVGASIAVRGNARIIAATNVDLEARIDSGDFRRDLYARLAVYTIHSPPLRDRRGDIPLLFHHFLAQAARRDWELTPEFMQHLLLYAWPMNVRELRSLAQRLAVDTKEAALDETDLPEAMRTVPDAVDIPDREELERLLVHHQGNVAEIATLLKKDRKQVYRWIARHDLDVENFRPPPTET